MWIVPYFEKAAAPPTASASSNPFPLRCIWVFMADGGAHVWAAEDPPAEAEATATATATASATAAELYNLHCAPNGLLGTPFYSSSKNTLFLQIDTTQTNLNDFYFWTEYQKKDQVPPTDTDVWRPFFWLGSQDPQDPFAWRTIAARYSLGSFGTIETLWDGIAESGHVRRGEARAV